MRESAEQELLLVSWQPRDVVGSFGENVEQVENRQHDGHVRCSEQARQMLHRRVQMSAEREDGAPLFHEDDAHCFSKKLNKIPKEPSVVIIPMPVIN